MKTARGLTVLHSYPLWLSQTQTWMYTQVAELQRRGIDAQVVCEKTQNLDQFALPNLHCLHSEGLLAQLRYRGLRKLGLADAQTYLIAIGRRTGARIVHSHFGDIGWGDRGAVRALGTSHVVTFYGFDVQKLPTEQPVWRARYRELFASADLFLCEGSHMAGCIVDLGAPSEKVRVHHLGVDTSRFEFRPRQWQPGQPLRVLIAASFREKKGIPDAVRALAKVNESVPVELTIIGDAGTDAISQSEKRAISSAIESSGFGATTRMLGYQPHDVLLREAYAHHLFLQPSVTAADGDTEGGAPVSIIEMLATGMPIVSTQHCDIPEVMGPDLQCMLAPERDVPALAAIIRRLISAPGEWPRLTRAGRDRVEREYDLQRQGGRQAEYYAALADQRLP